ncbi:MAG: InlB B-repeat-containing protein [Spirochaetaceae bacterium]|nr:InlB B-repeat-containing protein [Spirochaetaceae bacterium]
MSKRINNRQHRTGITASGIFCLFIFICLLFITGCPNPLIEHVVEPKKITFETNGGSSISTQTIFKGQTVSKPADPSRKGYRFGGWYLDNGIFAVGWDFGTVPDRDMTLYAKWRDLSGLPDLGGTASISGNFRIGQALTVDTSSITGGSGAFDFQWKSDSNDVGANSNTYIVQGVDAGTIISCVITRDDAIGSITASGQTIPFNLIIDKTGLTSSDSVSFSGSNSETYALKGVNVPISYTLTNTININDILRLSTKNTRIFSTESPGSRVYDYTVDPDDADNGVISIYAVFIHTNLIPLDPPTGVNFDKNGTITFTAGSNNSTAGGISYTYTLYKNDITEVLTDQPISNNTIPTGIVDEMLSSNGEYTVRVIARTSNSAYTSTAISTPSFALHVYSLTVTITGAIPGSDKITANGTDYISVMNFFADTDIELVAFPSGFRYVTWTGGSNDNVYSIIDISTNTSVAVTFAAPSININTHPAPSTDLIVKSIGTLSVGATTLPPGRTLSYQWYSNNTESYAGATLLPGEVSMTFRIPSNVAVGTYYYFCAVTSPGATPHQSNIAKVEVISHPGTITDATNIGSYLASHTGGNSDNDPIDLVIILDEGLGDLANSNSGWQKLMEAIKTADKYVVLDLSDCSMTGTTFDFPLSFSSGYNKVISIILPNDATSIVNETTAIFNILKDISGANITTIGNNCFKNCDKLNKVDFPEATTIGTEAFFNCSNLEVANLPKVASIGMSAFNNTGNKTLTITLGPSAPVLGINIFSPGQAKTVNVQIPLGATGYTPASNPFNGTTFPVPSADITTLHWGNAFRGKGWDGTNYLTGTVLSNITVNIRLTP